MPGEGNAQPATGATVDPAAADFLRQVRGEAAPQPGQQVAQVQAQPPAQPAPPPPPPPAPAPPPQPAAAQPAPAAAPVEGASDIAELEKVLHEQAQEMMKAGIAPEIVENVLLKTEAAAKAKIEAIKKQVLDNSAIKIGNLTRDMRAAQAEAQRLRQGLPQQPPPQPPRQPVNAQGQPLQPQQPPPTTALDWKALPAYQKLVSQDVEERDVQGFAELVSQSVPQIVRTILEQHILPDITGKLSQTQQQLEEIRANHYAQQAEARLDWLRNTWTGDEAHPVPWKEIEPHLAEVDSSPQVVAAVQGMVQADATVEQIADFYYWQVMARNPQLRARGAPSMAPTPPPPPDPAKLNAAPLAGAAPGMTERELTGQEAGLAFVKGVRERAR